MNKLMIPCLYMQYGKAVTGFGQRNLFGDGDVEALARFYSGNGADQLIVFDVSTGKEERSRAIGKVGDICCAAEIPVIAAGNIKCMDDVKELIYAGCAGVVLNFSKQSNIGLLEEVSGRFGKEKIIVSISAIEEFAAHRELIESCACAVLALDTVQDSIAEISAIPIILHTDENREENLVKLLLTDAVGGLSGAYVSSRTTPLEEFKECCKELGIPMQLASGARASFEPLMRRQAEEDDPLPVLSSVYEAILDRKEHIRAGSYTSYLFENGLDEILTKVGVECTELIVAAKNPDKDRVRSKLSDFLYHMMVLMAETGITWEELTAELSRR